MDFEYQKFNNGVIPLVNGEKMSLKYLSEKYGIDQDTFREHIITDLGYFLTMMNEPGVPCVVFLKSEDNITEFEKRYEEKIILFKLGGLKKEKRNRYGLLERDMWYK